MWCVERRRFSVYEGIVECHGPAASKGRIFFSGSKMMWDDSLEFKLFVESRPSASTNFFVSFV